MSRSFHKLQVDLRRRVLSLILLVPDNWRAALARNDFLTRVYEYFDRSKYEAARPGGGPRNPAIPASPPLPGLPLDAYDYRPPERTGAIDARLARAAGPLISLLMPVYNTPPEWLRLAIESVKAQWYPHWELCIVDDHSTDSRTRAVLEALDDPRIRVERLPQNQHIVGASNAALRMARGDYIGLLDHDDELTVDALYRMWEVITAEAPDLVYSDEDKIDEAGRFCDVHLKSAFSPDKFLSHNYLCHFTVLRRSLVEAVGGFTPGTEGAQDYDLFLKVTEKARKIVHIPRVLYHWRKIPGSTAAEFGEKSYAQDAGATALRNAIERRGLDATVEPGFIPGNYRLRYAIAGEPLVSIIVPFKDQPALLDKCVEAVLRSSWPHFELIGVSNNSEEQATFAAMERWAAADERIRFVEHNTPFNFSELNNFAVREAARGEQLLLLNNDVEAINEDWIECLLEFSQRRDVGVVGARLLYPNERVQHAGVILGMGGVGGHYHKQLPRRAAGYTARPRMVQNLCAVTAACCMVKRSVYEQVAGLDEEAFRVAFNDVDFCMRVRAAGYLNVYTPWCEAWHHESVSRGYEDTPEKKARFGREVRAFKARYAAELADGDPYYNPGFALMTQGQVLLRKDFLRDIEPVPDWSPRVFEASMTADQ